MKTLFLAVVLFFIVSVSRAQQSIHDTLPEMIPMQTLDEITVRPQYIRHQNNHYTIQVSPAEKGKNGEDLLRQAPGIWLSQGKISINGSSGTRVFIDGREIRLEGELFTNYLQSLKSEDIARIEVYSVAGAEHDANMKGGIIQIWMKRNRNKGTEFSAAVTTQVGKNYQQYQPHIGWKYHCSHLDWYGSLSADYQPQLEGVTKVSREYSSTTSAFQSVSDFHQRNSNHILRTGIIWSPDSLNTFGIEGEALVQSVFDRTFGETDMASSGIQSHSIEQYKQKKQGQIATGSLSYLRRIDDAVSEIKFLSDYTRRNTDDRQYTHLQQIGEVFSTDTLYRQLTDKWYSIGTANLVWTQNIDSQSRFLAGVKYTHSSIDDYSTYEGANKYEHWTLVDGYQHGLKYKEQIYAGYFTYSHQWKRLSIKAGLRAEHVRTDNLTSHVVTKKLDWFPSVQANYSLNRLQTWMLAGEYARYIERPHFAALSPNPIQLSEYAYQVGNPQLRPTYIHRFNMTLIYDYRYTLTMGGNLHTDLIREFSKQDAANPEISYITYENHYRENHWFVALSTPFQPFYWWRLSLNLIGVRQDIRTYRDSKMQSHYLFFGNALSSFSLPFDITMEFRYEGNSRLYSGNSEVAPMHQVHFQIRKRLLDDRMVITLGMNNLFNQMASYSGHLENYSQYTRISIPSSGRRFQVGISYRFQQGKKFRQKSVEKTIGGERNRLTREFK